MRNAFRKMIRSGIPGILGAAVFLMFSGSCRQSSEPPARPMVVTSVFPIYDLIRQVAGDRISLHFIVPAGANPHNYEMGPLQAKLISQSVCFIGIHPAFDGWITKYLPGNAMVFSLMDEHKSETGTGHSHFEDPHIWMSVREAKGIVSRISEILTEVDSAGKDIFSANSVYYQNRLDSLDSEIAGMLSQVPNKTFIQWHPAWNRFASDYDLIIAGTVECGHGTEVTARELQRLIQEARTRQVHTLVMGLYQHESTASVLVDAIGGQLIRLDTLGDPSDPQKDTYIRLMAGNAGKLAEALRIP